MNSCRLPGPGQGQHTLRGSRGAWKGWKSAVQPRPGGRSTRGPGQASAGPGQQLCGFPEARVEKALLKYKDSIISEQLALHMN